MSVLTTIAVALGTYPALLLSTIGGVKIMQQQEQAPKIKFEIVTPNFFFLPTKQMEFETEESTGRAYFIYRDKIVAVGRRER